MFKILQRNSPATALSRYPLIRGAFIALAILLCAGTGARANAQATGFTEIYSSGLLTLGPDESLQLTIVNNNNVSDPALPTLPTSEESCAFVAQFLDANGNVLQKQQQTLQPGQNFSFSQGGQSSVQARVDITPGTASGFARPIADQCVVSDQILNTSSADADLFAPLSRTELRAGVDQCRRRFCEDDCKLSCRTRRCENNCVSFCARLCP